MIRQSTAITMARLKLQKILQKKSQEKPVSGSPRNAQELHKRGKNTRKLRYSESEWEYNNLRKAWSNYLGFANNAEEENTLSQQVQLRSSKVLLEIFLIRPNKLTFNKLSRNNLEVKLSFFTICWERCDAGVEATNLCSHALLKLIANIAKTHCQHNLFKFMLKSEHFLVINNTLHKSKTTCCWAATSLLEAVKGPDQLTRHPSRDPRQFRDLQWFCTREMPLAQSHCGMIVPRAQRQHLY